MACNVQQQSHVKFTLARYSMKQQYYQQLANAIGNVHRHAFASHLTHLIKTHSDFDCAVIVGCRADSHPVYLFDSLPSHREFLFQQYLLSGYAEDPFHQQNNAQPARITHLRTALIDSPDYQKYLKHFHKHTGWHDEMALNFPLTNQRWVGIYLGKTSTSTHFTKEDIKHLDLIYPVILALCERHWGNHTFQLAQRNYAQSANGSIADALASFGKNLLTAKEREVVTLIIQGYTTADISQALVIAEGTVKNHRKSIFKKLHLRSQSDLFRVFLNFLESQL